MEGGRGKGIRLFLNAILIGGWRVGEFEGRDVEVGEYFVAVADGPVVREGAAFDGADVVECDFARVVVF